MLLYTCCLLPVFFLLLLAVRSDGLQTEKGGSKTDAKASGDAADGGLKHPEQLLAATDGANIRLPISPLSYIVNIKKKRFISITLLSILNTNNQIYTHH